ncbi:MAG: hypothetical protein AB2A00_28945 [Myxococcota bacterium]
MSQSQRPKAPGADLSRVDVEPVMKPAGLGGLTLSLDAPEELTPEDLAARATVGFALDLEPVLPGPPVGSERLLLETDPDAAARLGVRADAPAPVVDPAPPTDALASPTPAARDAHWDVDVEPVLEPPAFLEPPPPPPSFSSEPPPPDPAPPVEAQLPETLEPPPPPAAAPVTPVVETPPVMPSMPPVMEVRPAPPRRPVKQDDGARRYPRAFAWAGLGESPSFAPAHAPSRRTRAPAPEATGTSLMEDMLDLAAVGRDDKGVMEMHLIFKEEVLRGLVCKLRFEAAGLQALFVAPDETVRRYVESTANDLLDRMRRRGMKVGGWTVEVAR